MTDERNSRKPSNYAPREYVPAGVCTPARSNHQADDCPKPPPQFTRELDFSKSAPAAGPGFYVVPYSMNAKDLFDNLFADMPKNAQRKFSDLNPELDSFVKAGTLIILSDLPSTVCTPEEATLMSAAREVKKALEPLSPEEADFMHRHRGEIEQFISGTSTWVGVSSVMLETHLNKVNITLRAVERLHQDSYRQHGHLKSSAFFTERKRLLTQLDDQLLRSTHLRNLTTFGNHDKLKAALGISNRSLVHHWNKAGAPGQIPGYATHVDSISRAAKYMKTGGYIGIGIGLLSSIVAIREVCSADPESPLCTQKRFTEGGKFIGSAAGGFAGGEAGYLASGPVCLALGATTGVGGAICVAVVVGAGAWVGTTVGGVAGELVGETLYEKTR